jgi:cyclophilin family peptidyl-prolyl cis-trans isomerase/HEAT repeat protein
MRLRKYRTTPCALLLLVASVTAASGQKPRINRPVSAIPTNILLRILRAEDERRWDLAYLFLDKNAAVRKRAALAMGRIGDEKAMPFLLEQLKTETDNDVSQMIAFAIGEIESPDGAAALIEILDDTRQPGVVRARAVEALGKIGAALLSRAADSGDRRNLPPPEDKPLAKIGSAILEALRFEAGRRSAPDRETILLGLTAVLRAKPEGVGPVVVRFLSYSDPRIVADALNTLARLRLKDGDEQVRQLLGDGDAIVRANAARVLGATEDKQSFDALLARALHDDDLRVRVSAIRALGSLKDDRASQPLVQRSKDLAARHDLRTLPIEANEVLEIASALGRILQGHPVDEETMRWVKLLAWIYFHRIAPETDVALARISPANYLSVSDQDVLLSDWRAGAGMAQGLREIASLPQATKQRPMVTDLGQRVLRGMLDYRRPNINRSVKIGPHPEYAIPEVLRALAAFKPVDFAEVLRNQLKESDVVIRATAAELLGEQPPSEVNARALIEALPRALRDRDSNDAIRATLDALAKQKSKEANDAIKTALDSSDHLVRRRAVALLKANGAGDFSTRIGTVKTRNTEADYRRALARIGKQVTATVVTSKGSFTIEFLPEDAPLTVDNFVQLARKGYFNGITFHRVVPNFVIQGGDPRGDGNGGPGYSIRCEINEVPYERAAVGMALSGKDTGGSQWFVTHSPQPHLDGGYTVFGRVISGMEVVDNIARGDIIRSVTVIERSSGIR